MAINATVIREKIEKLVKAENELLDHSDQFFEVMQQLSDLCTLHSQKQVDLYEESAFYSVSERSFEIKNHIEFLSELCLRLMDGQPGVSDLKSQSQPLLFIINFGIIAFNSVLNVRLSDLHEYPNIVGQCSFLIKKTTDCINRHLRTLDEAVKKGIKSPFPVLKSAAKFSSFVYAICVKFEAFAEIINYSWKFLTRILMVCGFEYSSKLSSDHIAISEHLDIRKVLRFLIENQICKLVPRKAGELIPDLEGTENTSSNISSRNKLLSMGNQVKTTMNFIRFYASHLMTIVRLYPQALQDDLADDLAEKPAMLKLLDAIWRLGSLEMLIRIISNNSLKNSREKSPSMVADIILAEYQYLEKCASVMFRFEECNSSSKLKIWNHAIDVCTNEKYSLVELSSQYPSFTSSIYRLSVVDFLSHILLSYYTFSEDFKQDFEKLNLIEGYFTTLSAGWVDFIASLKEMNPKSFAVQGKKSGKQSGSNNEFSDILGVFSQNSIESLVFYLKAANSTPNGYCRDKFLLKRALTENNDFASEIIMQAYIDYLTQCSSNNSSWAPQQALELTKMLSLIPGNSDHVISQRLKRILFIIAAEMHEDQESKRQLASGLKSIYLVGGETVSIEEFRLLRNFPFSIIDDEELLKIVEERILFILDKIKTEPKFEALDIMLDCLMNMLQGTCFDFDCFSAQKKSQIVVSKKIAGSSSELQEQVYAVCIELIKNNPHILTNSCILSILCMVIHRISTGDVCLILDQCIELDIIKNFHVCRFIVHLAFKSYQGQETMIVAKSLKSIFDRMFTQAFKTSQYSESSWILRQLACHTAYCFSILLDMNSTLGSIRLDIDLVFSEWVSDIWIRYAERRLLSNDFTSLESMEDFCREMAPGRQKEAGNENKVCLRELQGDAKEINKASNLSLGNVKGSHEKLGTMLQDLEQIIHDVEKFDSSSLSATQRKDLKKLADRLIQKTYTHANK